MNEFLCIGAYDKGKFRPNLPNLCQFPKYTETGITWPTDELYTWVRLHLMWNVEFNTLDDFCCIDVHDLDCLGLIQQTCTNSTDTQKQIQIDYQMALTFK